MIPYPSPSGLFPPNFSIADNWDRYLPTSPVDLAMLDGIVDWLILLRWMGDGVYMLHRFEGLSVLFFNFLRFFIFPIWDVTRWRRQRLDDVIYGQTLVSV